MRYLSRKEIIGGLICLSVLAALSAYALFAGVGSSAPVFEVTKREGFEANAAYWKERIAQEGGIAAYADFKDAYKHATPQIQHTAAHSFGGALYAAEGVKGLGACDASFSYGCFHEFLGRAIEESGMGGVNTLNQACFDSMGMNKGLACTHGLGHGIQSYLGYSEEALRKALGACANLPYTDPVGGCVGGVFMEYNLRTMQGERQQGVREPGTDLLAPCNRLSGPDQKACYFWQPQWWYQLEQNELRPQKATYEHMAALCRKSEYPAKCFEGIGNITPPSADFDLKKSKELCMYIPGDMSGWGYCLAGAAMIFYSDDKTREEAPSLCEGLTGDIGDYCTYYSTGEYNRSVHAERKERPKAL